jgi:signal transduction histidine kinase
MKISHKVALILVLVQSILILISINFVNSISKTSIDDLEKYTALQMKSNFSLTIKAQFQQVLDRANDWANWDDTYNYILGKNPKFIEVNLNEEYLKLAKFNYIIFIKENNTISASLNLNAKLQKVEKNNEVMDQYFLKISKEKPKEAITDIVSINNQLIVWSMSPIADSLVKMPSSGYLVIGKILDAKNSPELVTIFGNDFKFSTSIKKQELVMESLGPRFLLIKFPILNNQNEAITFAEIKIPRSVNQIVHKIIKFIKIILLLLLIINPIIIYFLLRKLVFKRLNIMKFEFETALRPDSHTMLVVKNHDEIDDLAKCFNQSIIKTREEVEKNFQSSLNSGHNAQLATMGEITGSIVHEIKNPLMIIKSKSEQMKRELSTEGDLSIERIKIGLVKIDDTCKRISKIVDTVSRFSRNDTAKYSEIIDLNTILEDAKFLMMEKIKKSNITINVKNADTLFIDCNPALISLVFANLISNSIDATEAQESPWIEISFLINVDNIFINVIDSGLTPSQKVIEGLKRSYFTTKPQGKGTGLGLSFSRKIVEECQGRLYLDEKSVNTKFVIELKQTLENKKAS